MNSNDKITEKQNPISENIDELSIKEILSIMNNEDKIVIEAVKNALPELEKFIRSLVISFLDDGRLFYIGAGTSGRLGVLDASECPPTFHTDPEMIQGIIAGGDYALKRSLENVEDSYKSGELEIDKHMINEKDVVLGISANGSASYVHGALRKAKKYGATTGLLLSNKFKDTEYIDHLISVIVGPEIITGSTRMKSGTATKMVLNMISTTSMIKMNKTYGNLMVDLTVCNKKLLDRAVRIISRILQLDYSSSEKILKKGNGKVKIAVVMYLFNVSFLKAKSILSRKKGSLKEVIKVRM